MINGCIGIFSIHGELPSGPTFGVTFWVRLNYGKCDDVLKFFEVSNEIHTVRKGAEEAFGDSEQNAGRDRPGYLPMYK